MSKPIPPAYALPKTDIADTHAIQALQRGDATPDQQKRALKWVIENASGYYDQSYRPGDTHETAFAEGRRFVGGQVIKELRVNLMKLKEKKQ